MFRISPNGFITFIINFFNQNYVLNGSVSKLKAFQMFKLPRWFEGPGCFDTTSPEINLVFYLELPDLDMAPN